VTRFESVRIRNLRLTAIRWASLRHPGHAAVFQQILAIPPKRADKPIITLLDPAEAQALISAPDLTRWEGRHEAFQEVNRVVAGRLLDLLVERTMRAAVVERE
jgi:hypothetical protein